MLDVLNYLLDDTMGQAFHLLTVPLTIPTAYQSIISLILSALGIILNLFTVTIIYLHKPMHKHRTNHFVVNQSIIDTVASVMVLFTTLYHYDGSVIEIRDLDSEILCVVWFASLPTYGMFLSSIYGIVALTFERYLAVVHPF